MQRFLSLLTALTGFGLALLLGAEICSAQHDQRLMDAAKAEQPALTKTLEQLVNIETGTGDEIGLTEMADVLEGQLKAVGAEVTRHKAVDGVVGDIIVGQWKGNGGKHLLLIAHMDTVYARGKIANAPFRVEGDKAYGPGIADDKSGIAIILHTLRILKQRGFWVDYRQFQHR